MMLETTLRYHTYQAPADDHNARTPDTIAAENRAAEQGESTRWIDPQGVHEVLGPGQTVLEAFGTVFGDAIEDYNAKQKRADRKMTVDGYLESVENSRRGRPVKAIKRANERARAQGREEDVRKEAGQRSHYEVVVSLGNVKPLRDAAGKVVLDKKGQRVRPDYVGADVTRQILGDYIAGWSVRNPNLYLFRTDFHADEWYKVTSGGQCIQGLPGQWCQGEAHGHLSFVAFGEGYQRGPKRQASVTKALAAMGYVDYQDAKGRTVTAWEQWQEAERDVIREIARGYGYEIRPADDSREALAADEYAELADLRGAVKDAKAELAETEARTAGLVAREAAVVQRERDAAQRDRELDARERAIAAREREQEEQRERLAKAVSEFTSQRQEAHDLDERLPRLRKQAQDEQEKAQRAAQTYQETLESIRGWNRTIEDLQAQETALQARIAALQGEESDAYQDARERGYKAGVDLGAASAMGKMNAMLRAKDGDGLTDEQRRENAKRDGVGLV